MFTLGDEVNGSASGSGGPAKSFRPRFRIVVGECAGNGVGGLVGVAGIGVGDGAITPRLVTRQNVQLGFHRRRRDATLRHLRGLNKGNVGDGASGAEDARRSRSRRAKESLRHQHSRT